ncbi:MAG: hypothetical protein BGO78_00310 [Chloroflexi bacterium 44-23]|nr:MAG: hypothetical protein BGO78_00310 [Chloroflexi bacterium 44-23]
MPLQKYINVKQLLNTVRPVYASINSRLHGSLDILRIAGTNFAKARAPEAAASMAYYTLFSIFPLILVLVSFASFALKSQFVQDQILSYIVDIFPISPELILTNIENVLSKRGAVGFLALIGLMWSASNMFNTISLNIDRAWPNSNGHSFIERRVMGFAILFGLAILVVILWFLNALIKIDFVDKLIVFFKIPILSTNLWEILVLLAPLMFRLLMYWIMFQWLPKATVKPMEALAGAVFTLVVSELIALAMNWYLSSQWVRYELIYGSLGRIIALLLWVYLTSFLILFGAHISSAVAEVTREKTKTIVAEI